MPIELVREVDTALETLILAPHELPHGRCRKDHATLRRQAVLRLCRLSVTPIFLALHLRFVEVAGNASTNSLTLWVSLCLNMICLPLAVKQIPFVQASPSMASMILVAASNNAFPITTRNTGILVWLDALCTPIFHHFLDDISDREQLHYTVIGILLALASESTLFHLRATGDSIAWIFLTAIGAFVGVQVVLIVLVSLHVSSASSGPFGRSQTSSWVRTFTLGFQYTLFQANSVARQVWAPLSRRPKDPRRPTPPSLIRESNHDVSPFSPVPPGHIRLLQIHKRQLSETRIHCKFLVVPLASAPPYEAISYVWGSPTTEALIIVDNAELAITSSAYEIIQRRQSFWRERIIWIDQICINQRDADEKGKQVQMMRDIYTRASSVTAWLGNSGNAEYVQCFFAELYVLSRSRDVSGEVLRERIISRYIGEGRPHLSAVAEFFSKPWFRRVWIVQEAACAKRLYIIYGDVCMDWLYLCRAVAVLLSRDLLTIFPRSDARGKIFSLTDTMNRRIGLRNADTMMAFRGDIDYGKQFTLSWLLDEAMGFESTDPRDMVYALLGLTTDDDSRTAMTPNYDRMNSPAAVYAQAMRFLFMQARTDPPEALYGAGIGFPRSGKAPDLPSWVPDWSYSTRIRFLHGDYAAGTRYTFSVGHVLDDCDRSYDDDNDGSMICCCLHGEIFDQVAHLGPVFSAKDGTSRLDETFQLQKWYDQAYVLASTHAFKSGQSTDKYPNDDDTESLFNEAFIRTLLGNKSSGRDGTALSHGLSASKCQIYFEDMKHCYERYRRIFNEPSTETEQQSFLELHARIEEFQFLLGSSIGGRRFCVTKDGRMAVVPPLCEEGDQLVIVSGANMPFLLRERQGLAQSQRNTVRTTATTTGTQGSWAEQYELVGCCYVDSVMEGQIQIQNGRMFTLV